MAARIVIANACLDLVDNATAQKWVNAIQRQVALDFAPVWNIAAVVHYIGDSQTEKPGPQDTVITLKHFSSDEGTLGSHWLEGLRGVGEVGVQTCLDEGVKPESCLDHEVLEAALDPLATLCYQAGKLMLAGEVCDRVEGSDDTYLIDGCLMENFSTPAAFVEGSIGPWDIRGKCARNEVLPNGYQLQIDLGTAQWSQVTGALARRSKQKAGASSRRAARMRRAGVDPKSLVLVAA